VNGSVLLDTNVFTARLHEKSPLASLYAKHLFGQRLLVTPQTLAEARYGALKANSGAVRLRRPSPSFGTNAA
jgi:predicted nucleic acid-binding protein